MKRPIPSKAQSASNISKAIKEGWVVKVKTSNGKPGLRLKGGKK